jgi:hypothetical protein
VAIGIESDTNTIETSKALAEYLRELGKDLKDNPGEWENHTLSDFIESISAWIDAGGLDDDKCPLKAIANAMTAGKFYE